MSVQILLFVAALAALVQGLSHAGHEGSSWAATLVKTASVALLALAGWLLGAPGWIVVGLAFGAAGDFALARPGQAAFLAGMAAFALGHLAYGAEFVTRIAGAPSMLALAVIGGMALLVGWTALWLAPWAGALAWPVRAYGLVIGAMVAAAALCGQTLLLVGSLIFAASDLILALRLFVMRDPRRRLWAGRLLWPLYWGGQALILAGSLR